MREARAFRGRFTTFHSAVATLFERPLFERPQVVKAMKCIMHLNPENSIGFVNQKNSSVSVERMSADREP